MRRLVDLESSSCIDLRRWEERKEGCLRWSACYSSRIPPVLNWSGAESIIMPTLRREFGLVEECHVGRKSWGRTITWLNSFSTGVRVKCKRWVEKAKIMQKVQLHPLKSMDWYRRARPCNRGYNSMHLQSYMRSYWHAKNEETGKYNGATGGSREDTPRGDQMMRSCIDIRITPGKSFRPIKTDESMFFWQWAGAYRIGDWKSCSRQMTPP